MLVQQSFSYLLNNGYKFSFENICGIVEQYSFKKEDGAKVIISEDVRENRIDFKILGKNSRLFLEIASEKYVVNVPMLDFQNMFTKIITVYKIEDFTRGVSMDTFQKIITIYSDFLHLNLHILS